MSAIMHNPVDVTVTRPVQVRDDAGGFVDGAPLTIFTGKANYIVPRITNELRTEAAVGVSTTDIRVFGFLPPFPAVRPNDVVTLSDGTTFIVRYVRTYRRWMQIECFDLLHEAS